MPRGTLDAATLQKPFAYGTITLCGPGFPAVHSARPADRLCGPQPRITEVTRFGLLRFRSPLLAESRLISPPEGTKMFQFPSFPTMHYLFMHGRPGIHPGRVSPFGHPRVIGYLRLTVAFRSLSRPSSAIGAKAFTLRSL